MLCFTALCGLLEYLNLKDKREQQTDMKRNQKGSVCGELVRGLFWFVCSYKRMGIILHVSPVTVLDCYWYQLNLSLAIWLRPLWWKPWLLQMPSCDGRGWKNTRFVCGLVFHFPFYPVGLAWDSSASLPCLVSNSKGINSYCTYLCHRKYGY